MDGQFNPEKLQEIELPAATDVIEAVMDVSAFPGAEEMTAERFLALYRRIKPLAPDDPIIRDWQTAPWCDATLKTRNGDYKVRLFLGGMGLMQDPQNRQGAFIFVLYK